MRATGHLGWRAHPKPRVPPQANASSLVLWSKYGFVFFVDRTGLDENTAEAGVQVVIWVGERKRN